MDLFGDSTDQNIKIASGAVWLRGFALPIAESAWAILTAHFKQFPPQQMMTPMGHKMSVKTTSFGTAGWVGSNQGYGYAKVDPATQTAWPAIPHTLITLAQRAAQTAGYANFMPDTCLVNCYTAGTKMGLHQDKDEQDFSQPIVSVSLGIPATFLFGGASRADKKHHIPLTHGDIVVWGGESRRFYHGINTIKPNHHPLLGALRCNLTFRKAF